MPKGSETGRQKKVGTLGIVGLYLLGRRETKLFVSSWYGKQKLGGGFKYFLISPLFGEDFQFD